MMRTIPYLSVGAATFAAFTGLLAWLALHGFVSAESLELTGKGIAARDGAMTLREFALIFPPLPNLASLAIQWGVSPAIPAPAIASAAIVGTLAVLWIRSFVQAGYAWSTAIFMATALICGPAFLSLACEGPSAPMLALGAWLMGSTAFRLRARANIVDLMGFSASLAYLALCHPFAAFIVLGFAPFIVLVLPPQVTSDSMIGGYLAVLFPVALVLGGAAYVSWIFTLDPLGLFRLLSARSGDLGFDGLSGGDMSYVRSGPLAAWPAYALLVLLNAPVLLGGLRLMRRRLPRAMPLVALIAAVPLGGMLADVLGFSFPMLLMVAPLTGFAAAAVAVLPLEEQRPILVLLLVAAGALGSAATLRLAPDAETPQWVAAMAGRQVETIAIAEHDLGAALRGRNDVLIDALSSPGILAGRASARGLVVPLSAGFEMTRLSRRPATRYIAVSSADSYRRERDAVHAIFPTLYASGLPGYARIYDHLGWRVYERLQLADGG